MGSFQKYLLTTMSSWKFLNAYFASDEARQGTLPNLDNEMAKFFEELELRSCMDCGKCNEKCTHQWHCSVCKKKCRDRKDSGMFDHLIFSENKLLHKSCSKRTA